VFVWALTIHRPELTPEDIERLQQAAQAKKARD
jgi:hypothetical protein